MRFLAGLVMALGLLAAPAMAQKTGLYAVEGRNNDGSRYDGTLELLQMLDGSWRMTWQVAGATISGVGLSVGQVLSGAYALQGVPGVVAYVIQPDGRLEGVWTVGEGIGVEVARPQ
jgi:hypothetical protein